MTGQLFSLFLLFFLLSWKKTLLGVDSEEEGSRIGLEMVVSVCCGAVGGSLEEEEACAESSFNQIEV